MDKDLDEAALEYHRLPTPGKISVVPTKGLTNQRDLALAYSPGVAAACMAIAADPAVAASLTIRANLVAVVSNGTTLLGQRNIVPITGGTTMGRIEGSVLSGGADYQLNASGQFTLDARYTLKTKDGEIILVRNCGPIGGLVPVFEAKKDGPYAWINANTWLSSDPGLGTDVVNLTIYETN